MNRSVARTIAWHSVDCQASRKTPQGSAWGHRPGPSRPRAPSGLRPAEAARGAVAAAVQLARLPFPGLRVGGPGVLSLQGRGAWEPPGHPAEDSGPDSAGQGQEGVWGGPAAPGGVRGADPAHRSSCLWPFFTCARPSTGSEPSSPLPRLRSRAWGHLTLVTSARGAGRPPLGHPVIF